MARETACEERWRGQSERLRTMAPARHSSGSEKIENGGEFWNLKTCAVKKLIKVKSRYAVESLGCEHVHVDRRSNGCGLKSWEMQ